MSHSRLFPPFTPPHSTYPDSQQDLPILLENIAPITNTITTYQFLLLLLQCRALCEPCTIIMFDLFSCLQSCFLYIFSAGWSRWSKSSADLIAHCTRELSEQQILLSGKALHDNPFIIDHTTFTPFLQLDGLITLKCLESTWMLPSVSCLRTFAHYFPSAWKALFSFLRLANFNYPLR